jgi:hypothetical protein
MKVYDRCPLNCSHPLHCREGRRCSRCGSIDLAPVKVPPPAPFVSEELDDTFAAEVEREILAGRVYEEEPPWVP